MNSLYSLSVAICTRNRHEDLWNCLKSIGSQKGVEDERYEILLVDDGETDEAWLSRAKELLPANMTLTYHAKPKAQAGLLRSRILSVQLAQSEVLLFLDDDVECAENYFQVLKATLNRYPEAVGVSGADQGFSCSVPGMIYSVLNGQMHPSVGKLSWGGFASSMNRWNRRKDIFQTEFVHGCNMCFRVSSLKELEEVDWLNGYSLGEDLYLSHVARQQGPMYVNPNLKLQHHGSPTARDKAEQVSYTKVVNHYHLLQLKEGASGFHHLMLLYTSYILYLEHRLRRNREQASGFRRGIRELRALRRGAVKEPA